MVGVWPETPKLEWETQYFRPFAELGARSKLQTRHAMNPMSESAVDFNVLPAASKYAASGQEK